MAHLLPNNVNLHITNYPILCILNISQECSALLIALHSLSMQELFIMPFDRNLNLKTMVTWFHFSLSKTKMSIFTLK